MYDEFVNLFQSNLMGKLGFTMMLLSPFSMAVALVYRDFLLLGTAFVMLVLGGANLVYLTKKQIRQ
ncbi:hypothetical protein ACFLQ2_02605 [archaeon]